VTPPLKPGVGVPTPCAYDPAMAGIPDSLKGRSYTRVSDWSRDELALALDLADELKQERLRRKELRVLPGRTIGMIFHKPSTRTRVGFEVGIAELGGMALYLPAADLQLARGESYRDTALVLSRFVSALLIRTFDQAEVDTFAEHASIPVLNGLTDLAHPLQALADAMTIRERLGGLEGVRITYLGDGNNVCHSLMRLAARFGMHFTAACPAGYEPLATVVAAAQADAATSGGSVQLTTDPLEGSDAADVLYTDVWTSMGQEAERDQRLRDLERFSLDGELLSVASREAVAMHCLPAHVGEEITEDVLYGPRSLVWDQAENRLHTQKAVMALVIR
jgi:ornithine carbamoyltransferase